MPSSKAGPRSMSRVTRGNGHRWSLVPWLERLLSFVENVLAGQSDELPTGRPRESSSGTLLRLESSPIPRSLVVPFAARRSRPALTARPHVPASDRAELVEALYRFASGLDLGDPDLLSSALAEEATVDFTAPAVRAGTTFPLLEGRRAVTRALISALADLETSHLVGNPRVTAFGSQSATLSALVEGVYQPRSNPRHQLVLVNVYEADLEPAGSRWVITHLQARSIRVSGDETVVWIPSAIARKAVSPISLLSRRRSR
jgi:hypothetical protein